MICIGIIDISLIFHKINYFGSKKQKNQKIWDSHSINNLLKGTFFLPNRKIFNSPRERITSVQAAGSRNYNRDQQYPSRRRTVFWTQIIKFPVRITISESSSKWRCWTSRPPGIVFGVFLNIYYAYRNDTNPILMPFSMVCRWVLTSVSHPNLELSLALSKHFQTSSGILKF